MNDPNPDVLTCPGCGNTTIWWNLATGPGGTSANCGPCGTAVDRPDITNPTLTVIGWTDCTTVSTGSRQASHF